MTDIRERLQSTLSGSYTVDPELQPIVNDVRRRLREPSDAPRQAGWPTERGASTPPRP